MKRSGGDIAAGWTSFAKAVAVLEAIAFSGHRTLAAIGQEVGVPKSTLLRIIATLIDHGLLRRTKHGEYAIGLKAWQIGCSAIDPEPIREEVAPALRDLVARTSETAHFSVYEAGQTIYVDKVEGLHPIRSYTKVGGRSPAYATATGKAILAFQGEAEIATVAAEAQPLTASTHVGDDLIHHLAEVRKRGYAVNRGEWRSEVWGIAAPISDRSQTVIAAVGISGPRDRIEPNVEEFAAIVVEVARDLSRKHGALDRAS